MKQSVKNTILSILCIAMILAMTALTGCDIGNSGNEPTQDTTTIGGGQEQKPSDTTLEEADDTTVADPDDTTVEEPADTTVEEPDDTVHTHVFGDWTEIKTPTCTDKGTEVRACACGETETRDVEINENVHNSWGDWIEIKAPTCTEKGKETRTCACGESDTRDIEIDENNHTSWSEWAESKAPTCIAKGEETRICDCGETETRDGGDIDPNAHKWNEENTCIYCGEYKDKGLIFTFNNSKSTYYVSDYTGTATSVIIPSIYKGYPVTSIGSSAFENCDNLKSITIPSSVTSIKYSSFWFCDNLTNIIVELENPKYHSNGNCIIETETRTLVVGCKNSVIPVDGSVTSIGTYAFCGSKYLVNICIPNSITSIGSSAFAYCDSLTSITIPESVTYIGSGAFKDCKRLESITVASENSKYHSSGNCIIKTATGALIVGCKNSVLPMDGSITSIGDYAFCGHTSLESIIIPDSVTSIGESAFYCSNLTSITIPDSVTAIGRLAFAVCSNLTNVVIPDSVTSIGALAFASCSSLTNITIPENVTSIGSHTFANCRSLISITFKGTTEQWGAISKGWDWNYNTGNYTIYCTDGNITK